MASIRYWKNAGATFSLNYHLVWCTKYRYPALKGIETRVKDLIHEKAREHDAGIHALEVMPDHVHLFLSSDPTKAPAHLAAQFKGYTSRVLRSEFPALRTRLPCLWSRSYYIGSVGHVSDETVRKYISAQKVGR